jgi:FkbM family methyltransferase
MYFHIGWKLQNLGFRFRLLYELEGRRASAWPKVPTAWQAFRNPFSLEVVIQAQRFLDPLARYTLVDVGANIGSWAKRFLAYIPCNYVAFEPDPRAFAILEKSGPTHAQLHNVCVGDRPCTVQLGLDAESAYSSKYNYDAAIESRPTVKTIAVEQVQLDDLELGPTPFILKVDVQGAEMDVLRGARSTLGQTVMLILETPLFRQTEGANSLPDVASALLQHGFQPCYFCQAGLVLGRNTIPIEHDVLFINTRHIDPKRCIA